MANEPKKLVRFRSLCNLSLRPGVDELPVEFKVEDRPVGTPGHVLTRGEEWHFERTQPELDKLVKVGAIVVLPGVSETPGNPDEEN